MKDIKTGTLCAIIAMVSVLVMLIWGYVEGSFEHSWLAVMAAGICMAAISMIRKIRLFYRIDTKNDRINTPSAEQ